MSGTRPRKSLLSRLARPFAAPNPQPEISSPLKMWLHTFSEPDKPP